MLDGTVLRPDTCTALTDTYVPYPPAVPAMSDYVAVVPGHADAQTDYAAGDAVSKLADATPAVTHYLIVEAYSVSGGAIGFNVGALSQNPTTVSTAINSTSYNVGADVGFAVASTSSVTGADVGFLVGTLTQATGTTVGANIGTGQQNPTAVGANIETVGRSLDIEVSLITTELESVEDEP